MRLQIEHRTTYQYARPVTLGPHRLLIRPREGHDVQIRASGLTVEPDHQVRWIHDVYTNSIAILEFASPTDSLNILSTLEVEQFNTNPFDFILDPVAVRLPFHYVPEEAPDVVPYAQVHCQDDAEAVRQWIKPFLNLQGEAGTMEFLTSLNKSFPHYFQYQRREEPGVQTPGHTLKQRAGSCRDFAFLLMEAARSMGLAARFVSGYLCLAADAPADDAHNATHAWVEIYLPGAGWKGFDPTCGILAADLHVRVGVARHPDQAPPVSGTFAGSPADYQGMTVTVKARALP